MRQSKLKKTYSSFWNPVLLKKIDFTFNSLHSNPLAQTPFYIYVGIFQILRNSAYVLFNAFHWPKPKTKDNKLRSNNAQQNKHVDPACATVFKRQLNNCLGFALKSEIINIPPFTWMWPLDTSFRANSK